MQVDSLQSQLSEAQSQVSQIEEMNQQLSVENSQLSDEKRGLLEHVRQDDGGRAEMVEQDLGHVLQLISDGVTGGILKVRKSQDLARNTVDGYILLSPIVWVIECICKPPS